METKSMNVIEYVAPVVELLEVQVEAGFAGSLDPSDGQGSDMPKEPF